MTLSQKLLAGAAGLALLISATGSAVAQEKAKVFLSMSYIGNDWQAEASNMVKAMAASPEIAGKIDLQVQVAGETCPLLPSLRHHSSNGSPLNHINHTYSQPVGDRSCHTPALLAPCRAVAMTPHTAHGDDSAGRVGSFHFRQSPTPQVIPTLARRAR